tara:strand:+ start:490 stop:1359 length:870 start_codon:yes stop_codon:yes gene_type:complete
MASVSAAMVKQLRERTGLGLLECKKALKVAEGDIEKAIEELRKSSGMKAAKKAGRTAADGVVTSKIADDGSYGVMLEVNSETDFVARDSGFLEFVDKVIAKAFDDRQDDVAVLMEGELEAAREALVQKIGENIGVRRVAIISVEDGIVGSYVHSNSRIAVLTALHGGDRSLAKDIAMHIAAVNPRVVRPEEMPQDAVRKEHEIYTAQAKESGKPAEIIEKMISGRIKKFLSESSLIEQSFVKDPDTTVGKLIRAAGADVSSFIRFEVGEGIEKEEVDFAAEVAAQLQGQ